MAKRPTKTKETKVKGATRGKVTGVPKGGKKTDLTRLGAKGPSGMSKNKGNYTSTC